MFITARITFIHVFIRSSKRWFSYIHSRLIFSMLVYEERDIKKVSWRLENLFKKMSNGLFQKIGNWSCYKNKKNETATMNCWRSRHVIHNWSQLVKKEYHYVVLSDCFLTFSLGNTPVGLFPTHTLQWCSRSNSQDQPAEAHFKWCNALLNIMIILISWRSVFGFESSDRHVLELWRKVIELLTC